MFFVRYKSVVKEKTYKKVAAGFIVRPFLFFFFRVSLVNFKKTPTFSFPRKKKRISNLISDLCEPLPIAFADRRRRRLSTSRPPKACFHRPKSTRTNADDVGDARTTKGCGNGQLLGRVLAGCGRRKRTENERREQGAF